MIGVVGIASFYVYRVFLGLPERFPPSSEWVFFSVFFTICGYQIVRLVQAPVMVSDYLSTIGANTLFFFVVSTILIIILQRHYHYNDVSHYNDVLNITTTFCDERVLPGVVWLDGVCDVNGRPHSYTAGGR